VVLTLTLREVLPATPRARIVRLDLGGRAFSYEPGQAVLVATHGYRARRPYSLAAAPEAAERDGWLELLVGVSDDGHAGPHLALAPGDPVDVEGPVGSFVFAPAPGERRFLFVAGGTGIAPLRAMIQRALRIADVSIGVVYSARTPQEFAYDTELTALAAAGRISLRQTVTRPTGGAWAGARGRIRPDDLAALVGDRSTRCFICGPPALVDEIPRMLRALGVSRERIRIEEW
jgi:NAD(P)H-flavin reductase